jgi:amidase
MGEFPIDAFIERVERARRPDAQPVRARSETVRIEFRIGRRSKALEGWPAAAIGTETDGSVVSPSSNASLVGIKPTLGLVSRTGIIPIAHSQDTAGPMARTVADAALLLGVIAGTDPRDPATRDADRKGQRDYTRYLDRDGLRGARIGVVRNRLFGYSPAADRLAEAAIADLKRLGAVIVDPANIPTLGKFDESEFDVLLYEFKADLNAYLAARAASAPGLPVRSLKDVIAFNNAHPSEELHNRRPEILTMAEKKGRSLSRCTRPSWRAITCSRANSGSTR